MSTADELAAELLGGDLSEVFGGSLTYTAPGGTPQTIGALVIGSERPSPEQDRQTGLTRRISRAVKISTDTAHELGGIAAPVEGATVTIGGTVWTVETVALLRGARARLELVRIEPVRRGRPGYRGPRT